MKLIKRLNAYSPAEANEAIFGFGWIRARDYNNDKYGHLLIFSFNSKVVSFIKKLFIAI